jgi:translation elongation factor Ts
MARVEVLCETDFVAKGERFGALADEVLATAVASGATDAESLLEARTDSGKTVKELLDDANATIGEKIEVKRLARLQGETVVSYLHKTSPDLPAQIGVLVATEGGDETVARDLAMHIAAFSPSVLDRSEIPEETVENERRVAEATAREEGKPEAALPKIVEGRVNGFFKETGCCSSSPARCSAAVRRLGVDPDVVQRHRPADRRGGAQRGPGGGRGRRRQLLPRRRAAAEGHGPVRAPTTWACSARS